MGERGTVPLPAGERESALADRQRIVAAARGWIGTPYRHQAALKGVGCDCLGLLIGVWREVQPSRDALRLDMDGRGALAIPPYTPDWAEAMGTETFAEGCGGTSPKSIRPTRRRGRRWRRCR